MSNDYIYWTFSAAAQSISAFVALLLAGYAIVHTLMQAAREKDDSLEEIHLALLSTYHRRLTILVWLTGGAVISSLILVYFNRSNAAVSSWLVLLVSIIDIAAIVQGLAFVVSIVDPMKYQKAAKKALKQTSPKPGPPEHETPAAVFFDAFRNLERLVRDYVKRKILFIPSQGSPSSFRQMVDVIFKNELIDHQFYEDLIEINRYKNLVFHGHVDKADLAMVERVQAAAARIERLD
jgi:hypothetical protein